jgi:Zn-finger nucleic acid-binding protein
MQRTLDRAILPYRVEMDVCYNCNLIWLDQKKLEILQYVMQKFQLA